MFIHKFARNSTHRKKNLLFVFDSSLLTMRSCKRCFSLSKICTLDETSKKCSICVNFDRFCDLAISFAKMRRIHKERIRVRDTIRETKIKLHRFKQQLRQLKDEKEKMISSKWNVIDALKKKKSSVSLKKETSQEKISSNLEFLFDVLSKEFCLLEILNWFFFVVDFIDFDETLETSLDNSQNVERFSRAFECKTLLLF